MTAQIHPVDRLAELRRQQATIKSEINSLRAHIIETGDTVGSAFMARIDEVFSERLDIPALRAAFGPEVLKPYLRHTSSLYVKTLAL